MKVERLESVGCEHWSNYLKKKRFIYNADGKDYNNIELDIKSATHCIVAYTHKHDLLFDNCNTCADFAVDFMEIVTCNNIEPEYIKTLSYSDMSDCWYKSHIKDNTKSRNKIFKLIVNRFVDHIFLNHPKLVV